MEQNEQQRIFEALKPIVLKRIENLKMKEAGQILNSLVYDCYICPCNDGCCKDASTNCRLNLKSWLMFEVKGDKNIV